MTLRRNLVALLTLFVAAPTAFAGLCAEDVCARFEPALKEAILGSDFTIDVVADINTPVLGWGLDLLVSGDLTAVSQPADPDIGPDWSSAFAPDGDKLAGLAFPAGVIGADVLLARLHFHADADGVVDLMLDVTPGDGTEGFALDPSGFGTYHFDDGQIVVPEPAAAALWLLAFACAKRRRYFGNSSSTSEKSSANRSAP